jgi:hypothetical protein
MTTKRAAGLYWVLIGDEPEIARYDPGTNGGRWSRWYTIGSEDHYYGDEKIKVLAGPLEPPAVPR